MKTTLKIARAELRTLFYSPVAWLMIVFFFILCSTAFTEYMTNYFRIQEVFLEADRNWKGFDATGLSLDLTWPPVSKLVNFLYLFIPLLTMGIINREVNSGTIKLLYSSPVRVRNIVMGKYLGLLVLLASLILIVSVFLMSTVSIITNPDIKRQFAYLLGIFLVANAYVAIGLFISCVTNYQIVAGVLTFVVFFILNSISSLWQQYDLVRDVTYFLSIAGRADYLLVGLVSTRDLFYFVLITIMFLAFAIIKLKSTQESKPWTTSFARYALVTIVILVAGYFSSRPGRVAYWDLTATQSNTISRSAQDILKELDGSPLKITLYTNLLGINAVSGLPQYRNYYVWQVWEKYRRFYPNMQFDYVYYYDASNESLLYKQYPKKSIHQIAAKFAKEYGVRQSLFLRPEDIRKRIDLTGENQILVMQLEYKGKKTWLRTFNDGDVWPGQEIVSGSISRLVRDTVPKFLFVTGHYERNPFKNNERDYGSHVSDKGVRESLVNLGIDADTISLKSPISSTVSAVVIADPRKEIDIEERENIRSYLDGGGNALLLGDINKQQILNPVTHTIGVTLTPGTLVHPNDHEMPHFVDAVLTPAGGFLAGESSMYAYQNKTLKKVAFKMEGAVHLDYATSTAFSVEPIIEVETKEKTWIENGILVVDSAAPTFSRQEGDMQLEKYISAISLKRKLQDKEQRIIVAGDADMLTAFRRGSIGNAFYSWLLNNSYPFYANYPDPQDRHFNASSTTIKILKVAYSYCIPVIIIIASGLMLVRRKRK